MKLMDKKSGFIGIRSKLAQKIKSYIAGYLPEQTDTRKQLVYCARGLGMGVISFLMSGAQTAIGTYPLGLSLMAASSEFVPFIYAGMLTSLLFIKETALPLFITWTFVFLLRIAFAMGFKVKSFGESSLMRITAGVGGAVLISVYRVIAGGFLYYDVFAGVFDVISVPVMTYAFTGAFDRNKRYTPLYEAGVFALIFSVVYSLRAYEPFGFSLSTVAAFIITLYISRDGGLLRGGIAGLICGIACDSQYAAVFGIAGMVSGLLWTIGVMGAVAGACIVGVAYGTYLDGFTALRTFAPDLLGASVLFSPLAQLGLLPKLLIYSNGVTVPDAASKNAVIAEKTQEDTVLRLEALSDAMTELSEVFYTLSDRLRRPGILDVKQLCEKTFSTYCRKCGLYGICWDKEYSSTVDAMNKMVKLLNRSGKVDRDEVPAYLQQRCGSLDKAVADLNYAHAELLENSFKSDKVEVFAMDYESMAKMLETAMAAGEQEYELNEELCAKVKRTARYINLYANNIAVYGKRRKNVIAGGVDLARIKMSADEVRHSFENVCGVRLTPPRFDISDEYVSMTLTSMKCFGVESAKACDSKKDEVLNGDSICVFESREDYFYTLISDGMGSGRDAALTSRITGIFLEKMLYAGNNKTVTLEMLNNLIRSKTPEAFATVDLLEIDMLSGEASFIKSGAAPSYIMRDGSLFKITSNTMPVGITREINAEEIKFTLEEGDIVVMVSDGVAQCFEDSIWLANLLTFEWNDDEGLDAMAEKILAGARKNNTRSDDMTVGLVKLVPVQA